jgi:hypothetical protein
MNMAKARRFLVTSALVAVVVACGSDVAEEAGDMLVDAGMALSDAGGDGAQALTDAGAGGASKAIEVACTKSRIVSHKVAITEGPNSGTSTWVQSKPQRYAAIAVDTARMQAVSALQCGKIADPCNAPDPEKVRCEGDAETTASIQCMNAMAEVGAGFVRAQCVDGIETVRFLIAY